MLNADKTGLRLVTVVILVMALGAVGIALGPIAIASDCAGTSVGFTPISDLRSGQYRGYSGGLYPGGSNVVPVEHAARGADLAELVTPRDASGLPNAASGKIVFLSIGMSNTKAEFGTFVDRANSDGDRDPHVLVVNGAASGATADQISNPTDPYWTDLGGVLAEEGATAQQVQAVWLKEADQGPHGTFPSDAIRLRDDLRAIVSILKQRFNNLWLVYLSSRIYAGYATGTLNPEPYAYQGGFAVKWLIEEQIQGGLPIAADKYPWLAWGPYLWADGLRPRSDGLQWLCGDFKEDGTHPSASGATKVSNELFDFVHTDVTARAWYENGGGEGSVPPPANCIVPLPPVLFRLSPICLTPTSVAPTLVGR